MTTSALQPVSHPRARWRRRLLWGLGGLLVLELLYNLILLTGFLATVINHFTKEHPRIEWSRAWSLIPGHVHVRDLKLRHEGANGAFWQLEMGTVKVNLSLFSLLKRELKSGFVEVWGLQVRIHPGKKEAGAEKPKGPPPQDPWKVLLHGVRVHDVRQVDWNEVRLMGITEASGSLELVPRLRVSVRDARIQFGQGQIFYGEEAVARVEKGLGEFSLEAQRQEGDVGLDLIAGMTDGRFQFSGHHPPLHELPRLTSRLGGIGLREGAGRLDVDVHVKDGRLAPGTQIKGSGEPVIVSLGALRVRAPWKLHSDVYTPAQGGDRLGLKLSLGPARMEGGQWPSMETSEVTFLLGAKAPRLDESPPDTHLELHTEPLQATWGGAKMTGHIHVEVDARQMSVERGSVELHGSRVRLQDVSVRTGKDEERNWEGVLTFPEATLDLSPLSAKGRFSGNFSNAAPVVALLTYKGALPGVLKPLLTANNLGLSGAVSLGEGGIKLSGLRANGQGLELRGKAESAEGGPHAVLLVKMGILSVGVETGAGETHVQVLNASNWYAEKTGERTE
ncbi:hypothetical protein [Hyalangium gracile]|uniref:hypothetical protein n=1 Tax=Hyalangium gracile TaxID=394092 RepID=UPI001CCB44AB|nr:hypothetical protein [Hyalangium gracile]